MALPGLIPLEVLFGNPTNVGPQISPDGKRLAWCAPLDGVLNVWVRDTAGGEPKPVTRDKGHGVTTYFFAMDNRTLLYMKDKDGDENHRIFAADLETGEHRDLTPVEGVISLPMALRSGSPHEMLITQNRRDKRFMDVYHLDIRTGESTLVAENPGDVDDWVADSKLNVRGRWVALPQGGFRLRMSREDGSWQDVADFTGDDDLSGVVAFAPDDRNLYLKDSRGFDTRALVELNPLTRERKVLLSDPESDVGSVSIDQVTRKLEAVAITAQRRRWVALDPEVGPVLAALSKIQAGDLAAFDHDDARETWLAGFMVDDGPVSYHMYDRRSGKASFLFDHRPELRKHGLAKMKPVSFRSRDGLTLNGYLTLPPGVEHRNLPLVLNVHGGPVARDVWGFHPECQWFANRGYACLQVNFRGSSGYGKRFTNAQDREWGGKMHDDLMDGVEWAIREGYADRKKLAIYGGSYGGYASLVGATFTPDVFKCAVAMCGPSNLLTFLHSIPAYWETFRHTLYRRVGDPEKDVEFLKSRSPLFHADRIRIPMLIAQGANDPRVAQAESEQIVEKLRSNGHDVQYLLFQDEGHGFARPENRLKFYRAVDKFLAKHLGGRAEGD